MPIPVELERLRKALTLLREAREGGLTKEELRRGLTEDRDLELVSAKTVERCIGRLDEDGAGIRRETRDGRRVFVLEEAPPWDDHVSAQARLALRLASNALAQSGSLLWEEQLALIEQVLDRTMTSRDKRLLAQLGRAVHVSGGAEDSVEGPASEVLEPILTALADERQIRVTYLAAGQRIPKVHEVVPYALTHDLFSGGAYLLSWSQTRRIVIPLRLNRVTRVDVIGRRGVVGDLEKLEKARKYAIGGWVSTAAPFEVVIRVRGSNWVQALRDAPPALPDCLCTPERGGQTLLIRFKANAKQGALRWVLQFGEHAELLAPDFLREELRVKLEATMETYATARPGRS